MWIARSKGGKLFLYNERPLYYKQEDRWFSVEPILPWPLSDGLFPNLKWEDGPLEVVIVGI